MEAELNVERARQVRDTSHLPFSIPLELTIQDPDTIAELVLLPEGEPREQYALKALRIGVLALRQARGQIDADQVRRESERLLENLHQTFGQYSQGMHERLTDVLKQYFDPQNGRFQERVERLVKKDGELEGLLRRQIGSQDSELCKTLMVHLGQESPLMKMLSPDQSKGVIFALRNTLDEQLKVQREHVLNEFSLDNKQSALSRFIAELATHQGKLSDKIHGKIDEVVKEFSLDQEDSALSRLVRNVERAQRTITSEFSLDDDASALSRLKKMLENTNETIHSHLSLDDDQSALARLKRELLKLLKEQSETNQKFQEEVKGSIRAMMARREEADRSTRHGLDFEDAVFQQLQTQAQRVGDIATHTGNTSGKIKKCKVGDCVVELGPESAAPGARIAVEAKEKSAYDLARAREEIELARKNRAAQVGLFVYSKRMAPAGLEPLSRYAHDVVVVWDSADPSSDLFLQVGLTLARALCVRSQQHDENQTADFSAMDEAILEIEKRATALVEIETWTETIRSNSEKIRTRVSATRKSLEKQVDVLRQRTLGLRAATNRQGDDP